MKLKKLTVASLMIAIGVVSSHLIYFPIGMSKAFPVQHTINLLAATFFGPAYGVAIAFATSLIRNLLGTGSLLAFPGSMIGAFLAGLLFKKTNRISYTIMGEVFGSGILGGIVSYPLSKYLMGKEVALFFYIGPFAISSIAGVVVGYLIFKSIYKLNFIKNAWD